LSLEKLTVKIFMLAKKLNTQCCIVGGGPAGMMLGFLLARGGIEVIVLEKHGDFFRDFRGDTIHPSTFEVMHELGLLDEFLKVPHQELHEMKGKWNNTEIKLASFDHLHATKPVVGLMPQWDFLKFIEKHASVYPAFKLIMNAQVKEIIKENGRIAGVIAETKECELHIFADLVVGTDGRHSTIREKAGLKVITSGVPIDVLWFRLSRQDKDPSQVFGLFYGGELMVLLDRNTYWQCGYIIRKGEFEKIKQNGLQSFKDHLSQIAPFIGDRVNELKTWDDVKLLTVAIDHLDKWYSEGVICIGDAAHAMSPIGGVGINLALQDAVAAANILYQPLKEKKQIANETLHLIQKRREFPTRITQYLQVKIQNGIFSKNLGKKNGKPPLLMRLLTRFPILRRIPARLIGIGFREEHVRTPEFKQ
jgi:2-polyprenyl-6-methoxyphenol hydroxylase-like FAD-dependent oxidoreductase